MSKINLMYDPTRVVYKYHLRRDLDRTFCYKTEFDSFVDLIDLVLFPYFYVEVGK